MMTSSNRNIFLVTGPLSGGLAGHRWIPRTNTSDAELWCFLWSAPCINGWVNIREAGDLRRHRVQYDVIVMYQENLFEIFAAKLRLFVFRLHWIMCCKPSPTPWGFTISFQNICTGCTYWIQRLTWIRDMRNSNDIGHLIDNLYHNASNFAKIILCQTNGHSSETLNASVPSVLFLKNWY